MVTYKIKRWFRNWLNDDQDQKFNLAVEGKHPQIVENSEVDAEKFLDFRLLFAQGGRVIQTRRYDRNKDRSHVSLYIVTDDQNLGQEIENIITMESLRS